MRNNKNAGERVRGSLRGRAARSDRAGNAGIIATIAIAMLGIGIGATSSYLTNRGALAEATTAPGGLEENEQTQAQKSANIRRSKRDQIVAALLKGTAPPERLKAPEFQSDYLSTSERPKVIVIIDDMGVDVRATEKAISLPGPLTFSFLPYARNVASLADKARSAGHETMLHLPMEPMGKADPGPKALSTGMTGGEFISNLEWNLARFDGYVGVNNHMGSKLTSDLAAMKTLLAFLDHRELFFLDSLTTGDTVVRKAANAIGVNVYSRDVFLDDAVGDPKAVRDQLALAERVARETGYVVAIGHPRKETLDVLGPWLTSAPARGFDLVYVSALAELEAVATPVLQSNVGMQVDIQSPSGSSEKPGLRL